MPYQESLRRHVATIRISGSNLQCAIAGTSDDHPVFGKAERCDAVPANR